MARRPDQPLLKAYGGRCGYAGSFCTSAAPDGYCTAHHCTYMSGQLPLHLCALNQHDCTEANPSGECRLPFCLRHTARFTTPDNG